MKPPVLKKKIDRSSNSRIWLYILVNSVVSGLTAAAVGRFWGEAAGFWAFFFTAIVIPGLLGIDRWVYDYPNGAKGPDRSLDELF